MYYDPHAHESGYRVMYRRKSVAIGRGFVYWVKCMTRKLLFLTRR